MVQKIYRDLSALGNHGRKQTNHPLPSFSSKIRPDKTSVLAVAGFHGVVQAIPFDGNFTAAIFEYAMENIVLPALPNDCHVVTFAFPIFWLRKTSPW